MFGRALSLVHCSNVITNHLSANQILVQENIADEFTKKLVAKVAELRTGPGLEATTTQGPLVNQSSVAKVTEHVEDAVSKGAKVLIGGKASSPGFFYEPTVLVNVPRNALVAKDETFGPLAPIFTFVDEEDAI